MKMSNLELKRALPSEQETKEFATRLAAIVRLGDVIALEGEIGAGKTVFARAFVEALGGGEEVPSPTFTLVQTYNGSVGPIHHFDLYRLDTPEEALELGMEELLPEGISLIEWPDRLGPYMPCDHLTIRILENRGMGRILEVVGVGEWRQRMSILKKRF